MANEITYTINFSVNADSGVLKDTIATDTSKRVTMTGRHANVLVQDIGTSAENLTIAAEVATLGWVYLKNIDQTNYVEVGVDNGSGTFKPVIRLNANESCLFRWAQGITPQARANTATVKLKHWTLEN